MALPLPQALIRLIQNEESLDLFVNGSDTQSYVTRGGQQVPTLRRFLRELRDQIIGIAEQPADGLIADLFVVLSQKASIGSKNIIDVNYISLPSDVQIVYSELSQIRTVELPNILDFPYGQDFVVADGTNSASETKYIEIRAKTGTEQTINQNKYVQLTNRGQALRFRRASDSLWFIL